MATKSRGYHRKARHGKNVSTKRVNVLGAVVTVSVPKRIRARVTRTSLRGTRKRRGSARRSSRKSR